MKLKTSRSTESEFNGSSQVTRCISVTRGDDVMSKLLTLRSADDREVLGLIPATCNLFMITMLMRLLNVRTLRQ